MLTCMEIFFKNYSTNFLKFNSWDSNILKLKIFACNKFSSKDAVKQVVNLWRERPFWKKTRKEGTLNKKPSAIMSGENWHIDSAAFLKTLGKCLGKQFYNFYKIFYNDSYNIATKSFPTKAFLTIAVFWNTLQWLPQKGLYKMYCMKLLLQKEIC